MKKFCFMMSVTCLLVLAGCGTTKSAAADTVALADSSPQTNTPDSPAQSDKNGQEQDTNTVSTQSDKAESEQNAEESLEMVAQEDVIQAKPVEDDEMTDSSHVNEPEVLDAPAVEYDTSTNHALAENEAEAQGTSPVQQTSGNGVTQAGSNEQTLKRNTNGQVQQAAAESTDVQASGSMVTNNDLTPQPETPAQSGGSQPSPRSPHASAAETLKTNETTAPRPSSQPLSPQNTQTAEAESMSPPNASAVTAASAEDDSASSEAEAAVIPLAAQKAVPSRSVTIKNNQYLDIVYPGSGWVYLGEAEENRDQKKQPIFSYFGRKLGTADTTFTLRSRKSGTTLLHFYKNDALTGQYIDDYLAVTIENESAKAGVRASAPAYAEVVPPKPTRQTRQSYENIVSTPMAAAGESANQAATGNENTETAQVGQKAEADSRQKTASSSTSPTPAPEDKGVKTVIQTTESSPAGDSKTISTAPSYGGTQNTSDTSSATASPTSEDESNLDLLEQAKRSYAAQQYETALDQVQRYLQDASSKIDEALFLQGQIWEAESSVKNIRSAIDSYESLTKNYPMSSLWGKANNRIIYLKRFYIEIR